MAVLNLPTKEGYELGSHLARFADAEADKHPTAKHRCDTCAFRKGTPPNGCLSTLGDAMKCLFEKTATFYCHEREGEVCAGFALLAKGSTAGPVTLPWPFSDEPISENQPNQTNAH